MSSMLGTWLQRHIHSSLSPVPDQSSNWLITRALVWMWQQKQKLSLFSPLTFTGIIINEENPEKSILVMPKFATTIAIF